MKYKVNNLKDFIKPPKEPPKDFTREQKINGLIWDEKECRLVFKPITISITDRRIYANTKV